jgi:hypothetical protein
LSTLEIEEDTQTTESDAISLFNESYKKGIKLLVELSVVKESPESIATYLHETKGLDKVSSLFSIISHIFPLSFILCSLSQPHFRLNFFLLLFLFQFGKIRS